MADLKCKMCGGRLNIEEDKHLARCIYCDSVQTIPDVNDEKKLSLFSRANELRLNCDFDQAASVFQSIVSLFPDEAEAYWGICLCKYGIEYVDDAATLKKIPTCHRTNYESILNDSNYLKVLECADICAKDCYENEAKVIDELQKKIISISYNEQPYDIFISYKETDDLSGRRTSDSFIAQDIYTELVKNGYRVFYSRVSLRDKAGSEYEPYIFSALNSARIMLVIGSKEDYLNAVWVKNEWSRFLNIMKNNSGNKAIITCYENITPESFPEGLRRLQGLDMANKIFFNSLLNSIMRIIPKEQQIQKSDKSESDGANSSNVTKKEIDYKNGVYVGEALGQRPHGWGVRYFTNDDRYEGNWHMGNMQGKGTFYYNNGDSWTGEWVNSQAMNGSGKLHTYNSNTKTRRVFEGTLKDGHLEGEGKIYVNGVLIYEGNFLNGKLEGQGASHGECECSGEWKNGKPWNAKGTYFRNDQWTYTGEWKNGAYSGPGKLVSKTGQSVEGIFENGTNSKNVKWIYKDKSFYIGPIVNGKREGKGSLFGADNKMIYSGEYHNDCENGQGVYYCSEYKYEGGFENANFEGQGIMTYANGTQWQGTFKKGNKITGYGHIYYYDDKGKLNGNYYFGNLVNGEANGQGEFYNNGYRYVGEFYNDDLYNGTCYDSNNLVVDTYVAGKSQREKRAENWQTAANILNRLS